VGAGKKYPSIRRNSPNPAGHWFVKLKHKGERKHFDCGTNVKSVAQVRALEIKMHLRLHGMAATLKKYNPKAIKPAPTTIGEYWDRVEADWDGKGSSLTSYRDSFFMVAADIADLPRLKQGAQNKEFNDPRREKIRALSLSIFSVENVEAWKSGT
jgi:hypothetical protein